MYPGRYLCLSRPPSSTWPRLGCRLDLHAKSNLPARLALARQLWRDASYVRPPRRQHTLFYASVTGIRIWAHTTARPCGWSATGRTQDNTVTELQNLWEGVALFAPLEGSGREQASWTYVMLHWLPSYFFFFVVGRLSSGNGWRRMAEAQACLQCDSQPQSLGGLLKSR